jgi:uncharacterized protein YbbC (DUF1343 family)
MRVYILIMIFNIGYLYAQTGVQLYESITTGAQQTELYLPRLLNKNIAIVTNASGIIANKHLVDTLLKHKLKIVKIFGPEHGFRGTADAGEKVKGGKDPITNIPIVSLYGTHKKPTKEDLKGIDIVIYDIQDVGVRFYTYISTMAKVMEACAENGKELIVFDRPNPNGFYIDGPVMTDKYKSFLGMHNVPIVYGMTCGEYALMVNGEGWLKNKVKCKLSIIPLKNYNRSKFVTGLPIKPSPNLPNDTAILLYPTLGLFEGTIVSLGRGTDHPFQYIGNPFLDSMSCPFKFTPKSTEISKRPKYQDTLCYGLDMRTTFLSVLNTKKIDLTVLNLFYHHSLNKQDVFFDRNFNYHAGNEELKQQTILSISSVEIRDSWKESLATFKKIRSKYLIYKDF